MPLTNLRTIVEDPSLHLPIGDTVYVVPPCSAELWLELQEQQARVEADIKNAADDAALVAVGRADDTTGIDLYRKALGPAYHQMLDGGVTFAELTVAGMTAYLWQLGGPLNVAAAQAIWESGGKALAPAVAALTSPTRSGRTGAAGSTTRRRNSGTTTRTPATRKAAAKKAARTRSPKSSPTAT